MMTPKRKRNPELASRSRQPKTKTLTNLNERMMIKHHWNALPRAYLNRSRLPPFARACSTIGATYTAENVGKPPSLEDIATATSQNKWIDKFWISLPARMITFVVEYFSFPYLSQVFNSFVTMQPDQLHEQIRAGDWYSVWYVCQFDLSILYEQQRKMQEYVAVEASLLVSLVRTTLSLFRKDKNLSINAAQCAADQIRTLVASSRGEELMLIMYSDPYARIFDVLDKFEEEASEEVLRRKGGLVNNARDTIKDLMRTRVSRWSDEALALPPTHFLVLNLLTTLILVGYIISTLPTMDRLGEPSLEGSLIFRILTTTYILFYIFASGGKLNLSELSRKTPVPS